VRPPTHAANYRAYNVPFRLELAPGFAPETLIPHGSEPDPNPESPTIFAITHAHATYTLTIDHQLHTQSQNPAEILEATTRELMIHVANLAPDRVFVHAGVVAWRNRALVLPGPSFAGKSTLVAALLRAGATYFSDEYAVIDPAGLIHPHARNLRMREPGAALQTSVPASQFSADQAAAPLRAALIVFTRYEPGAIWNPQPVTPGRAILEMLRHTIPVQRTPSRVMATLAAMIAGAEACETRRAEADSAAAALLSMLESAP
jgi:hypothetical protein